MAATFVNLESHNAFRICSTEASRNLTAKYAPHIMDENLRQIEAYKVMPLEELFTVEQVQVEIPHSDLPGPSLFKAVCEKCHTVVRDKKEVRQNGQILCRSCAHGAYYRPFKETP